LIGDTGSAAATTRIPLIDDSSQPASLDLAAVFLVKGSRGKPPMTALEVELQRGGTRATAVALSRPQAPGGRTFNLLTF
jgi:hypothetical protein